MARSCVYYSMNGMSRLSRILLCVMVLVACFGGACQASRPTVAAMTLGVQNSAALLTDGTVWTWGDGGWGCMGNGIWLGSPTPSQVPVVTGITAISSGADFLLALKSDGTVWAWGHLPGTSIATMMPVQIAGLSDVVAVSSGYSHAVALKRDGTVWAWGSNDSGQLGDGTGTDETSPVLVTGLSSVTAISAGLYHTAALKADGRVWIWGDNDAGQLGDGTYYNRLSPGLVAGLDGVTAISAGSFHTTALKGDGTLWAWGSNYFGGLGNGSTNDGLVPQRVPGLTGVVQVSAGYQSTLAVLADGTLLAWGLNYDGQLGNDTETDAYSPQPVLGISNVSRAVAGYNNSCAIRRDGSAWSWGYNGYGVLGDGSYSSRYLPVPVTGLATDIPYGSISVNGGAAGTRSRSAVLSIQASDPLGKAVSAMKISIDGQFDAEQWEPYATSKPWTLYGGDGPKVFLIQFRNSDGIVSNTASCAITLDTVVPAVPVDLAVQALSPTSLRLTWRNTGDAVTFRIFRNGVFVGQASSSPWIDTNLTPSTAYTYQLSARDIADNESALCNPVTCWTPDLAVGQAKQIADGGPATLVWKYVTATDTAGFYAEELDRSSGILVVWDGTVAIGDKVSIAGTLATEPNGERSIHASQVTASGSAVISPLMLTNKSLGGGDYFFSPATGAGQRGVEDGAGLNNVGELVKSTGKVSGVGQNFFYIDDGTHATDDSIFIGVRVICPSSVQLPQLDQQVSVTGISTIHTLRGRFFRAIKVLSTGSVVVSQ